ncbi:hypothetical protein APS_2702 [Acetobacter pasteurianus subsp. pasteurianus LMG 1262 = NBRC 106471]|nr:hypothetical protein APS_2702 [Acetobacter pasteurianus subsp. pasteurianus LMG 1262 = NBRC 106471]
MGITHNDPANPVPNMAACLGANYRNTGAYKPAGEGARSEHYPSFMGA